MEDVANFEDQVRWLENIQLSKLSNRALTLASRLSHSIRRLSGKAIGLQEEGMAARLGEQVMQLDDEKLNTLFREFLEEVLRIDDSGYPTPPTKSKKQLKSNKTKFYRGLMYKS